jgi:hypothetical protein
MRDMASEAVQKSSRTIDHRELIERGFLPGHRPAFYFVASTSDKL